MFPTKSDLWGDIGFRGLKIHFCECFQNSRVRVHISPLIKLFGKLQLSPFQEKPGKHIFLFITNILHLIGGARRGDFA